MGKVMQEGAKEAAAKVRGEVDAALGRVTGAMGDARRVATLNVVASCVACLAAAVALWATVH
ncbi:MAG: conjugal transfer protein TraM [Candidatus Accumulibacter sp. SK-11]|nr:MAG: conjugal transfer protein TraM [Candidatus Accumulibacter sp. SK-11]